MYRHIAESDWRLLRQFQPALLNRYCERVLNDLVQTAQGAGSEHERYLKIYKLVDKRNEELARAFDGLRRSSALVQMSLMRSLHLFTDEEFAQFSEETRGGVDGLLAR